MSIPFVFVLDIRETNKKFRLSYIFLKVNFERKFFLNFFFTNFPFFWDFYLKNIPYVPRNNENDFLLRPPITLIRLFLGAVCQDFHTSNAIRELFFHSNLKPVSKMDQSSVMRMLSMVASHIPSSTFFYSMNEKFVIG